MGRGSDGSDGRGEAKAGTDLAKIGNDLRDGAKKASLAKKRVRPGGRNTSKHRGDVAEMEFMIEAARRRFGVAKPFGDDERYDVILDGGWKRLWRVQVKSSASVHHRGFAVRACWRTSGKHLPYTAAQIDFLSVVIRTRRARSGQIWYVIPVRALRGRLTINLYPFGGRVDCTMEFEKYRDAWKLLGRTRRRG